MDQQQAPRSGQPKARRRHPAEGARNLVLAVSVATATGITAGMVLHATTSPASASGAAASAAPSNGRAVGGDDTGGDDDGPRAAAVASTTPVRSAVPSRAIAVPSTSSRGS